MIEYPFKNKKDLGSGESQGQEVLGTMKHVLEH